AVFEHTHRLLLQLIAAGRIDGLRIDHADGLYDPAGYFRRLQQRCAELTGRRSARALYLVVEKITASFEHLPDDWPVHGETGYRFANVVNRMLVDSATRTRMDRAYRQFIDEPLEWREVAYQSQQLVLRRSLASELNVATNLLARLARADRRTRDFTFNTLRAFHADSEYRVRRWPHEMLATSTHDTKRSEDVRARLNVLSEMSTPWREAVRRWSRFNRSRRRELEGLPAPSPNDEYHFYQTLFGSWPLEEPDAAGAAAYRERIEAYMIKAAREAKLRTSWTETDAAYEEALLQFVRSA